MAIGVVNFQLGKSGLTDSFIEALRKTFTTHKIVKISVLKTGTRDKEEMKKMAGEICSKLADKEFRYDFRMIGFKVTVRRFRQK